jgi:ATPase subunit of ABC transporter with duplicated ATPase domains
MIADINVTEKSFGPKLLMTGVKFSMDDHEKVGLIGRNGIGKSTLFGILTGSDKDYTGEVIFHRGTTVVATAQEHHGHEDRTVMEYILQGVPEYAELSHIIHTYPETMGDDMRKIEQYSEALDRFGQKNFYQIEELVAEELKTFQLEGFGDRLLTTLSGGQKRLIEVVKVMHSDADLALLDEPTNHMDYVAKKQFIDWMRDANEAMIVITHDRDVLREVDRIVELKDGGSQSFKGNYDAYLKQNAMSTGTAMSDFEMIEKRIVNLKQKVLDYQRLKEKSRNPSTIQRFKRLENMSREELHELEKIEKPTFWIDRESVAQLDYKVAGRYDKFKARNIRLSIRSDESRSKHVLVRASSLALGYGDNMLFDGVNIDLREGEALELRGRNGAGKTTLIKALLKSAAAESAPSQSKRLRAAHQIEHASLDARAADVSTEKAPHRHLEPDAGIVTFYGELTLDPHVRVGVYEQEISEKYLDLSLAAAIERMYLDRNLPISETKVRQLMSDYLFADSDRDIPLARLSGGQKARFQLISMLASDPQLLILDEPTNHLDLPSIEELEAALQKYSGAILYVSHDGYFRDQIGGEVVQIGTV